MRTMRFERVLISTGTSDAMGATSQGRTLEHEVQVSVRGPTATPPGDRLSAPGVGAAGYQASTGAPTSRDRARVSPAMRGAATLSPTSGQRPAAPAVSATRGVTPPKLT